MLRPILFRGKALADGDYVYGYYTRDCFDCPQIIDVTGYPIDVDEETIGQWTGKYDNTGRKIFEGDVLEYVDAEPTEDEDGVLKFYSTGKVIYDEETCQFKCANSITWPFGYANDCLIIEQEEELNDDYS